MKIRRIDIERLQLVLPRTALPGTHARAVALARAVATNVAKALEQSGFPPAAQTIPELEVKVPRRQANPAAIASAIHASVVRFSAPSKGGR